jgi:hypothetical protein
MTVKTKVDTRKLMELAVDVMNKSVAEPRGDGKASPCGFQRFHLASPGPLAPPRPPTARRHTTALEVNLHFTHTRGGVVEIAYLCLHHQASYECESLAAAVAHSTHEDGP